MRAIGTPSRLDGAMRGKPLSALQFLPRVRIRRIMVRFSSLVSDMAHVIGQGGFGGVWAAKNLKAIGFLGTKSIEIANPQAMMDARLWAQQYTWGGHADNPNKYIGMQDISSPPGNSTRFYGTGVSSRPYGCVGCVRACRGRTSNYYGNEAMCIGFHWFTPQDKAAHDGVITENTAKAATLLNRVGMNANSLCPSPLADEAL